MAFTRSPLSLVSRSTGAVTGRTVALRKGSCTRFSATVTAAGTTKASFRMQGSIDGVKWTNLGSAATTMTSTGAVTVTSTSTVAYQLARINQMAVQHPAATSTGTTGHPFTGTFIGSIIGY